MLRFRSSSANTIGGKVARGGTWLFRGGRALVDTLLAVPLLVVWWLLYRWNPDPP